MYQIKFSVSSGKDISESLEIWT